MTLEKALQVIAMQAEKMYDLTKRYEESEEYRNMWREKVYQLEKELEEQKCSTNVEEFQ